MRSGPRAAGGRGAPIAATLGVPFALVALVALASLAAGEARAEVATATSRAATPHVAVELVARDAALAPGRPSYLGIDFTLEEGWHVYWRNPGDSGLAPTVAWTLPAGVAAGAIEWPFPERIAVGPLVDYGYSGSVLLPVELSVAPDVATGAPARIAARVEWLVCREDCIPGAADLALELPVEPGAPRANPRHAASFAAARERLPRAPSGAIAVSADDALLALELPLRAGAPIPTGAVWFAPAQPGLVDNAAPQELIADGERVRLIVRRSAQPHALPARLEGVVVSAIGFEPGAAPAALRVDAPISTAVAGLDGGSPAASGRTPAGAIAGLATALGFAFLGGLILNLMPCVFPVLSLKILDFVRQAGGEARAVRRHGLAYGAGILVSFWILAGALLALRAGGEEIGWGFQLQSPGFVSAMALLSFALALSLLGVFDIGVGVTGAAGRLAGGSGIGGSFATGVLATALATPCTAPFMGAALGYALGLAAPQALAIFTALALGMAAPYVLLCFAPRQLRLLPRPGAWMETLKQALAFPLLATVVWLVWVRAEQGPSIAVLRLLSGLLLLAMALWLLGRRPAGVDRRLAPRHAAVALLALVATVTALSVPAGGGDRGGAHATTGSAGASDEEHLPWQPFSPARLASLRGAGTPVFVDFTAAWCLTCQVNDQLVFSTEAVREAFAARGVALLRADWTRRDPEITRALESFGRSGVPLYVLYAGSSAPAEVLPAVLTPGLVLEALERVPLDAARGGAARAAG